MKTFFSIFLMLVFSLLYSQKDSLNIGDYYAEDQLYFNISYAQFLNQPEGIDNNNFSYSISSGFIKDIILNKKGTIALAGGIGIGGDYFNHNLKIEEIDQSTVFTNGNNTPNNKISIVNVELPLQIRWRTSTANRYKFWRIYTGVKFLYNAKNTFSFTEGNTEIKFKNISSFTKWQYGVTLSTGYAKFNINVFYSLTPVYKNAILNEININTKVLKVGLIFYFL